jgi:hypothetical protein
LNEKDLDFTDLAKEQACNHFENITSLTTKRGFCDLLRDIHWNSHNALEISPRCYNLGDPIHRDEFIDDFRNVAATNILKWYILHIQHDQTWCRSCVRTERESTPVKAAPQVPFSSSSLWKVTTVKVTLPPPPKCDATNYYTEVEMLSVLQDALTACVWHLRVNLYGEWPEVDISKYFKDRDKPLEETQWAKLLDFSYDIADLPCDPQLKDFYGCMDLSHYGAGCDSSHPTSANNNKVHLACTKNGHKFQKKNGEFDPYFYRMKTILLGMAAAMPQLRHIDGFKNIWVIKAPDSSCGIGIKLHARLDEILQSERGDLIVVKYLVLRFIALLYLKPADFLS